MKVAGDKQGTAAGALAALVAAAVGLAVAFGVHIDAHENAAILTFTGAVVLAAPLVGSIFDHANKQVAQSDKVTGQLAAVLPVAPSPADVIQQQIDNLQAQKDALGGAGS